MPSEFREPAWHRLGKVLDNPPTVQEAIAQAGLDWTVLEEPVYGIDNGNPTPIPGYKRLVRDRDRSTLGIVSSRYRPLQNIKAFEWFNFLLHEGDISLETAGSLRGGRRVWILAKINDSPKEVRPGDAVAPYLTLSNSHDGTLAVWFVFTPIRIVCANTLTLALRNREEEEKIGRAMRICHNSSLDSKMEQAKSAIDLSRRQFALAHEQYQALEGKLVSPSLLLQYVGKVFDTDNPIEMKAWAQIQRNFECGQGNRGQSLWDAMNAVTEYLDYQRGRSDDTRLDSSWFGEAARIRRKAHREALALL
jgi:phage/plasmid-like protein (TIGR03299 family)